MRKLINYINVVKYLKPTITYYKFIRYTINKYSRNVIENREDIIFTEIITNLNSNCSKTLIFLLNLIFSQYFINLYHKFFNLSSFLAGQ